jgi:hypothetical protein
LDRHKKPSDASNWSERRMGFQRSVPHRCDASFTPVLKELSSAVKIVKVIYVILLLMPILHICFKKQGNIL